MTAAQIDQLKGAELDLAVAEAIGIDVELGVGRVWHFKRMEAFSPSSHWSDAGPLLERMAMGGACLKVITVGLNQEGDKFDWRVTFDDGGEDVLSDDPSYATAICRTYLKWKAAQ